MILIRIIAGVLVCFDDNARAMIAREKLIIVTCAIRRHDAPSVARLRVNRRGNEPILFARAIVANARAIVRDEKTLVSAWEGIFASTDA